MLAGAGGHLGQVGDAEHLVMAAERGELLADDLAAASADADIDFVKDKRGHGVGSAEDRLERQHQARALAAAGDASERPEWLARIEAHVKLDAIDAVAVKGDGALLACLFGTLRPDQFGLRQAGRDAFGGARSLETHGEATAAQAKALD